MKSISIDKTIVRCDKEGCGWKKEDEPKNWHNKQCPKCNDCIIITDEDMKMAKAMRTFVKTMGNILPEVDDDSETCKISISSKR